MVTGLEAESLQTTAASGRRLSRFVTPLVVALLIGVGLGYLLGRKGADAPSFATAGPTRVENGVPLGYAQTEKGAVAAATNFEEVRSGALLVNENAYSKAISTMAADQWRSKGESAATLDVKTITDNYGSGAEIETASVRYKVGSFTANRASVILWVVTVIDSGTDRPVDEIWSTVSYDLVWADDDWRVGNVRANPGSFVPKPFNDPTSESETSPLREFESYSRGPS